MQIIKIGFVDGSLETEGCEKAPNLVLDELKKIKSNEKGDFLEFEKLNLEEIHVESKNKKESEFLIVENSKEIFEKNFKSFFIGGDDSISYSLYKGFSKVEKLPLFIVIDSAVDCSNEESHRSWIRRIIDEGGNPGNFVFVSCRNFSIEENEYIKKNKITTIKMDILREDLEGICDILMERSRNSSGFFVSIDMNCLDPGFAPGVCNLMPGGLYSGEMIYLVKRLKLLKNFKGAGIFGINPEKDLNSITLKLGAKLIAEMI
jgi:arginase